MTRKDLHAALCDNKVATSWNDSTDLYFIICEFCGGLNTSGELKPYDEQLEVTAPELQAITSYLHITL